ncbi:sodium/calcium exchanger family protein [Salix suchowensis]|nr:sodium/calcium exchanger family protein [Salix suchowensis]
MRNSFSFNRHHLVLTIPALLLLITAVHARYSPFGPSDLISDGSSAEETCEQTYGFLPCTTTVIGNLFLILVYGYLMFFAATYLSSGVSFCFRFWDLVLLVACFFPSLALFLMLSGISGTTETAQSQVSVGMGLLAGSTVMLLTVIWGSCVVVGKWSGVSTDIWTCYAAIIMAISVLPFVVVFQPWIQERRIEYTRHKLVMSGILKHLKQRALGRLLTDDGSLDEDFIGGIKKWLDEAMGVGAGSSNPGPRTHKYINDFHEKTKKAHALLGAKEQDEGEAAMMLLAGAVIAAAFADPLVDAVDNFSDATSIPTFFISFIALPLATNSSEAVSAIIFASRKKVKTASLTFSEIYGAVTMNNVLCLSVFLALVYFRELTWDFSAEVLVICIVCIVMGAFASFRTTFPLWTSFLAFFLYPFSLVLVYVLDYVLGWS